MASSTQTGSPDPAVILKEITENVSNYVLESVHDFQDFAARPRVRHWLRIIVIVAGYIMVRPLIELFFKTMFERQSAKEEAALQKKRQEEDEQLVAEGLKKPKKDGNSMRVGRGADDKAGAAASGGDGQKAAEGDSNKNKEGKNNKTAAATTTTSNNKDEYEDSDQEDFAEKIRASGVLEWGRDARRRKGGAAVKTTEATHKVEQMDEEKLKELLDWSEDEDEEKQQ